MYGNSPDASPPGGSPDSGGRGQRYTYLVSRLRNRQITMEEATELFNVMQAMIARANEIARAAAQRVPTAMAPAPLAPSLPPPRGAPAAAGGDDLLLVGILAMGAGAGLLAALSKRMGEPNPPTPSGGARTTTAQAPP